MKQLKKNDEASAVTRKRNKKEDLLQRTGSGQIYETVFALLKGSLFCENNGFRDECDSAIHACIKSADLLEKVLKELRLQTVSGIPAENCMKNAVVQKRCPDLETWTDVWGLEVARHQARFLKTAVVQQELIHTLQKRGIAVVIIKGFAAAYYYPHPELRSFGDIDALVSPEMLVKASAALEEAGFEPDHMHKEEYHLAFLKDGISIELHHSPSGIDEGPAGPYIRDEMRLGLQNIEWIKVQGEQVPVLPWKQNGIEFIWHIREHLYNGLGLRQILDWMMFADKELTEKRYYGEFRDALEKMKLQRLAAVVTRMCQMYLGLREDGFSWCKDVPEETCEELMDYLIEQGNFGIKTGYSEKTVKVISGYRTPAAMLRRLQKNGSVHFPDLAKKPMVRHFLWVPEGIDMIRTILFRRGFGNTVHDIRTGLKRDKLFRKLYD